jgi:hypothetical protein
VIAIPVRGVKQSLERIAGRLEPTPVAVRQRIIVPFTGHVIGEGFNSQTVERVGMALTAGNVGEDKQAPGQSADFKFLMLTSQDSLEKALNVGAQIDARYGLFSGGAKFDFAESSAINTTSTYILASCVVTNALRSGSNFTPTEPAERLIRADDQKGFLKAFGDRFTQALHTGGEFHALVRVTSSDTSHQRRISASLHAELNGLFASGSFKASLEEAQKDASSHTEIDIQVHQTGGVGPEVQIPGTDADQIRAHMDRFAAAAHANAAAFQAELVTYDTLALPFGSEEEQEEKRQVLEDCLARRQQYWSAISDLAFAQSENAPLIFENLPSREVLLELQNEFRRVLNDLMAHSRRVADGTIEPTVFVATDEPVRPIFKRRTSGSFASWWTRANDNDPGLLQDERILIDAIAGQASSLLTVPLDQAPPEAVERAANLIDRLHLETPNPPHLGSMASLPKMIDAPLQRLWAQQSTANDLSGIEPFSRLEFLFHSSGRLRDLGALSSAAALTDLRLFGNQIEGLSPLRALIALERLMVSGNEIRTLEPIRALTNLVCLVIAGEDLNGGFLDNPIVDARALADLPHLGCALTTADRLDVRVFDNPNFGADRETPPLIHSGTATRIGDSHRFRYTPDGGEDEQMVVCGLVEYSDLADVPAPIVAYAVSLDERGIAVGATRPDDRSASLAAAELVELWLNAPDLQFAIGPAMGPELLATVVEVTPTSA